MRVIAQTLLVLAFTVVCHPVSSGPQEIVILQSDDPLLRRSPVTRGELAEIAISYFPREMLQRLSLGREIPEPGSHPDSVWNFLNVTGMIPAFSDGSNHPEDTVTRGQMAILLQSITRLLPFVQAERDSNFLLPRDVARSSYCAIPVCEVLLLGLMNTDSTGRFNADRPLTGKEAIEAIASFGVLMKGRTFPPRLKIP